MKIKQIYHIGLPCNNLERATKFYSEVLGMKCTKVGFDTDSGGPYKEVYGSFPSISRLFMEDGICLVLFVACEAPYGRRPIEEVGAFASTRYAHASFPQPREANVLPQRLSPQGIIMSVPHGMNGFASYRL